MVRIEDVRVKTNGIIWYVIADAARARLVKLESGPVRSLPISGHKVVPALNEEFVGRNLKSREILADRLGQRSRGHPAAPNDAHDDAKTEFALALAHVLENALSQHRFEHLMLTAPPDMLGKLRDALSAQVRRSIVCEQDKDLTQLPDNELAERLANLTEKMA